MKTVRSNVDLIKIKGYVSYMKPELYTQFAHKGPEGRYYVNRGSAGGISISAKRVEVLACGIYYV